MGQKTGKIEFYTPHGTRIVVEYLVSGQEVCIMYTVATDSHAFVEKFISDLEADLRREARAA